MPCNIDSVVHINKVLPMKIEVDPGEQVLNPFLNGMCNHKCLNIIDDDLVLAYKANRKLISRIGTMKIKVICNVQRATVLLTGWSSTGNMFSMIRNVLKYKKKSMRKSMRNGNVKKGRGVHHRNFFKFLTEKYPFREVFVG